MADPTLNNLSQLILSGLEIKELTGWPDAMVEDYLNILRDLILLATTVDENGEVLVQDTQITAALESSVAQLRDRLTQLQLDAFDLIHGGAAGIDAMLASHNARLARLAARVDALQTSPASDVLLPQLARTNRTLTMLIDELITAMATTLPDKDQQTKILSSQQAIRQELRLMNERIEEAYQTQITINDINED